jgi:hypothetical protein
LSDEEDALLKQLRATQPGSIRVDFYEEKEGDSSHLKNSEL